MGTSLFWGAGVTLRFLLVLWVPVALGITSNATPTYLNAMVAVGIVLGPGGGEAGDAGDGVALYACRDFDWRRGDLLSLQHALPALVCC
jgi:LPLT family lysophospholipid transporter-like MFS transporter